MFRKHFSEHYFNPFKKTVIGNDVWIGENALVKAGVTIANGAVVGMGSVVTRDIGPYEIWVGNPARLLRKRFSDENIELLLKIKWWDFSESELKRFAQDITEIGMIRDKY
jgi:acetyltransferase-like isoleucine patch superfamily enzyme